MGPMLTTKGWVGAGKECRGVETACRVVRECRGCLRLEFTHGCSLQAPSAKTSPPQTLSAHAPPTPQRSPGGATHPRPLTRLPLPQYFARPSPRGAEPQPIRPSRLLQETTGGPQWTAPLAPNPTAPTPTPTPPPAPPVSIEHPIPRPPQWAHAPQACGTQPHTRQPHTPQPSTHPPFPSPFPSPPPGFPPSSWPRSQASAAGSAAG